MCVFNVHLLFMKYSYWFLVLTLVLTAALMPAVRLDAENVLQVLDVGRVRADKAASNAVLRLVPPAHPAVENCDVLVVGGSTGGTSAALAAAQAGVHVCVTEETAWLGGQMTSQGVSEFDENRYIETAGGTASYYQLRNGIRNYYRDHYTLSALGKSERYFNPGNCWVSALCFQAPVALDVLNSMLKPYEKDWLLRVFLCTKAVSAQMSGNRIKSVLAYQFDTGRWYRFRAKYFIDATDIGELLPLTGAAYVTGAESRSQTGEPNALKGASDPNDDQSFTYSFDMALVPHNRDLLSKPAGYEKNLKDHPYTFTLNYGHGKFLTYGMFTKKPGTPGSFWTYRRLTATANFTGPNAPREISLINWPGNDYCGPQLLSTNPLEQAKQLRRAKLLALGFAYWLQHDAPRNGGGRGYPQLRFITSELGSTDGLSQYPYIRESRRIQALQTIREQDISSIFQKGPRSRWFPDSVGIGFYPIDIHSCSKKDFTSGTKPFQLPLGALIPVRIENLLAGSKDIGTTHITNGAYREHPIEWAIGEAAGWLAALSFKSHHTPKEILEDAQWTTRLQLDLIDHGVPIYWFDDLKISNPAFRPAQLLAAKGIFGGNDHNLHFSPATLTTRQEALVALARLLGIERPPTTNLWSTRLSAHALHELVADGYWPRAEASPPKLDHPLLTSDLEDAAGKTGIVLPQDSPASKAVSRSRFAIWLRQVYLARNGMAGK